MNRSIWLALVAEFGPILLFFIAGRWSDFFTAVALFMIATVIATAVSWISDQRIPWLPIISALFVIGGGTLTLWYHHPDAIIVADTLFYLTMGSTLALSLSRQGLLLKVMFGTIFDITDTGWRALAVRWCCFLFVCAVANEVARALLEPAQWIDYRFFKTIIVTLFATYQMTLVRRYRLSKATAWGLSSRI